MSLKTDITHYYLATTKLQVECLDIFHRTLSTEDGSYHPTGAELQVCNAADQADILQNHNPWYTVAV